MINNELKEYNRFVLLTHADSRFPSAEPEQPLNTYTYRSVPERSTVVYRLINSGIVVHCLYRPNYGSC